MRSAKLAMGAMLALCIATVAYAQQQKGATIKEAAGGEMGEVQVRRMAPLTYAYVETQTTFDKLGDAIGEAMPQLMKAAEDGKYRLTSPFILTYPQDSAHLTPDKPFKVQIGLKVESGDAAEAGNVKVRKTEDFRAATVLYTGSPTGIGQCYQRLFPAIKTMGLTPSGEEREFTLYWENFQSPNNVVLVQVGIREQAKAQAGGPQGGLGQLLRGLVPSGSAKAEPVAVGEPARVARPVELDVLNGLVGSWESSFTEKRGADPQPEKRTGRIEIKWILGGRYLYMEATSSEGIGSQMVIGFDPVKAQFHRWTFSSRYGSSELWGTFDQKNKTFTWKTELANGARLTMVDRQIDKESRGWTMVAKDRDDQMLMEMNGTSRRLKGAAPTPVIEITPVEATADLKVLDRYAGGWEGQITLRPSPWTPQEVKQTDTAVFQWVLGGRFMRIDASSPDGGQGLHFMTHDANRGEYRHWFFHSQHEASESAGQWEAQTSTFNWKSAGPPGMTALMSDKWVNDNQRNWNYIVKEADGKVMFQMEATSTRRK